MIFSLAAPSVTRDIPGESKGQGPHVESLPQSVDPLLFRNFIISSSSCSSAKVTHTVDLLNLPAGVRVKGQQQQVVKVVLSLFAEPFLLKEITPRYWKVM